MNYNDILNILILHDFLLRPAELDLCLKFTLIILIKCYEIVN